MKRLFMGLLAALLLGGCALDLGQDVRYGNYGGAVRQKEPEPPFSIESTYRDVRWFPTHVRWAPDDSHLLVSLCHTLRPSLCRIGKYFIAKQEWEILPYEDMRTYRWPVYHPDGKEIAVSTGPCDEQYRCALADYVLVRMASDGSDQQLVGDVIATDMSFSPDGKKLIYWRYGGVSIRGRAVGLADVYEMDWPAGTERALTEFKFMGEQDGSPFFLDDAKAILFWARSPNQRLTGMHYLRIQNGPITRFAIRNLEVLWPIENPDFAKAVGDHRVFDVGQGDRILYFENLASRRVRGDLKALVKQPNVNEGALLLRRRFATDDEGVYRIDSYPFAATVSSSAKQVAFLRGGSAISFGSLRFRFGIIGQGEAEATNIDWPKVELKPGRQTVN